MTTQSDFREVGEDFVAHYGKKGMHWGVRNSRPDIADAAGNPGLSKPKKVKPTSSDIKAARARQSIRERKYEESQGDYMVARTNKGQAKAEKVMRKLEKDYFLGKDAETANRMTKGEKITTGILLGVSGLILAGMVSQASRDAQGGKRTYTSPSYYNDRSSQ